MPNSNLLQSYRTIRQMTLSLCEPLKTEDFVVQSQPDVSPIKWHLGHTTWFFEKMILRAECKNYVPFNHDYDKVFNSYYQVFGQPWSRHRRGVLSRPTVEEILEYRKWVDKKMEEFLSFFSKETLSKTASLHLTTGFQHEQQHQELMLMDIKLNFSCSPISISYQKKIMGKTEAKTTMTELTGTLASETPPDKIVVKGGVYDVGADADQFAYDNEFPRHRVLLTDFSIDAQLVSNREYLAFIEDGAYQNFTHWHADAWEQIAATKIDHPMYWRHHDGEWFQYTLQGEQPLNLDEPVCHINFYEACAFAEWSGRRLPTEFEWEVASQECHSLEKSSESRGHFLEDAFFHPRVFSESRNGFFGGLWEWTSSSYSPYPGYSKPKGALQEYNSKFMINQQVLRGGSFATPRDHIRPSYRNFYQPDKAWAFTGLRLAEDL